MVGEQLQRDRADQRLQIFLDIGYVDHIVGNSGDVGVTFAGDGNDYVLAWQDSLGDYIDAGEGNDQVTTADLRKVGTE